MTTTNLTNPYIEIDGVDFTDQCTAASVISTVESLENTAFGDVARKYGAGLQNNEITCTLYLAYGASEIESKLAALIGTNFDVVVGKSSGTPAADNPVYTLTGCYLETYQGINGDFGSLSTTDVTFRGGAISRAVS